MTGVQTCALPICGKRIENIEDVMKVGDKVQVEIAEIDPKGKLSLVPVLEGEAAEAAKSE